MIKWHDLKMSHHRDLMQSKSSDQIGHVYGAKKFRDQDEKNY